MDIKTGLCAWLLVALPGVLPTLGAAETIAADENAAADYGELNVLYEYAKPEIKTGHLAMKPVIDFMQPYFDMKESLAEMADLNYIVEYSPILQRDLEGNAGTTLNDETNLIAQWAPLNRNEVNQGSLIAWYQISRTPSYKSTSEFQDRMGVLSPVNGGDTGNKSTNTYLQHFAWEQWMFDDRFRVMAGKLTTRVLLNLNRYAVSDREDFMSPMMVNNPVVTYTARLGLGAFAQYKVEDWYLSGMVRQADGTSQWFDFGSLEADELEYVGEFALTPKNFLGLGAGNYRFTPSYTDSVGNGPGKQPSGWTMSFSFDQDVGERLGTFFRYAYASEDYRAFTKRASLGTQIKKPLGFEYDRIGLAGWWGDPANGDLDSEYGLEAYWMIQVAPFMELSADIQTIIDPALDDSDFDWVGGLRVRIIL